MDTGSFSVVSASFGSLSRVLFRVPPTTCDNETVSWRSAVGLAAFLALIYHYSGEETVAIGFPSSGRHHPDVFRSVGNFANALTFQLGNSFWIL